MHFSQIITLGTPRSSCLWLYTGPGCASGRRACTLPSCLPSPCALPSPRPTFFPRARSGAALSCRRCTVQCHRARRHRLRTCRPAYTNAYQRHCSQCRKNSRRLPAESHGTGLLARDSETRSANVSSDQVSAESSMPGVRTELSITVPIVQLFALTASVCVSDTVPPPALIWLSSELGSSSMSVTEAAGSPASSPVTSVATCSHDYC